MLRRSAGNGRAIGGRPRLILFLLFKDESSSAPNLPAMTVAMAATELRIPFHLSIPQSFRAKDHGAGAEGISFLLLLFQNHAGLKFMFHLLNFSRNVEISDPYHPIVR